MIKKRIHYLHERYARGRATEEELAELRSLLVDPQHDRDVLDWLDSAWADQDSDTLVDMPSHQGRAIFERISKSGERRRRGGQMMIWSAAAVMIISSALLYHYWSVKDEAVEAVHLTHSPVNDIEPGTDRAVLMLADGKQLVLDGHTNGVLLTDSLLKISKEDGNTLMYSPSDESPLLSDGVRKYNTLITPIGGQFKIRLPDGTKVTLNASSELKFPHRFSSHERLVEFQGEACFEVSPDADRPFVVKTIAASAEQEVRVLGTTFNINSYDYDKAVVTTVVGGRVEVNGGVAGRVLLDAGQQSLLQHQVDAAPTLIRQTADINETIAWKEGLFVFNNESLPTLLKRLSRWYGVEFIGEEDLIDVVFQGNYFRDKGLLNLLTNLEATGRIQFRINQNYMYERRIYVMEK